MGDRFPGFFCKLVGISWLHRLIEGRPNLNAQMQIEQFVLISSFYGELHHHRDRSSRLTRVVLLPYLLIPLAAVSN
ncbi:asl5083 [Nostoc sp. PCC 7120 = FACHB-418]|nr:asl5083 [Nostoc sp. PCC 7120 = FACHB-418]